VAVAGLVVGVGEWRVVVRGEPPVGLGALVDELGDPVDPVTGGAAGMR
jgi:hypothetical protein